MFIIFHPFLWITIFYSFKKYKPRTFLRTTDYGIFLTLGIIFSYMIYYRLNFSSRFTSVAFIFFCLWFLVGFSHILRYRIFVLLFMTFTVITSIYLIQSKKFYISGKDEIVQNFEKEVPRENSVIITLG